VITGRSFISGYNIILNSERFKLKKKIKYLNFIGLLLLAVILWKIDFNEVMKYLKNVNYWYLLLAYPFLMLNISLKSVRWNFLMRSQGVQLPLSKTLYVYLWGYYFGTVTPGRIGEISKAIYFQDNLKTWAALLFLLLLTGCMT
jgi:uncharacterized protein (TIRG00374 family)